MSLHLGLILWNNPAPEPVLRRDTMLMYLCKRPGRCHDVAAMRMRLRGLAIALSVGIDLGRL